MDRVDSGDLEGAEAMMARLSDDPLEEGNVENTDESE